MPLAHAKGAAIFFAHVPKAGGSSVEAHLVNRFGTLSVINRQPRKWGRHGGIVSPAAHLTAADMEEFLPPDLAYSFTMVRDPVKRLLSEYKFQSGISRLSRLGFSTWLRVALRALATEPRIYSNHVRPQTDFVPEDAEVFFLEDDGLDKLSDRLDELFGAFEGEQKVEHLNKRSAKQPKASRQDALLIEKVFAADYERFGFARTDPSALEDDGLAPLRGLFAFFLAPLVIWHQRLGWVVVRKDR